MRPARGGMEEKRNNRVRMQARASLKWMQESCLQSESSGRCLERGRLGADMVDNELRLLQVHAAKFV